jgi:catechol 2,3-dioxygenase-like lactoylglutathione lyase family enzyme
MRGVIHHLVLTVQDPERSFAFYDAVLSALGYSLERKDARGFDWYLKSPLAPRGLGRR